MAQPVLFVEQLTNIDSCILDANRGIIGETILVDIKLHGLLDSQGMVMDFGKVKKTIKNKIDETLDHVLIIPKNLAGLDLKASEQIELSYKDIHYKCPQQAAYILDASEVTLENLARELEKILSAAVSKNVDDIEIDLVHEKIDGPYYHYYHGLKKHDGNCQRLAHGHRSKIVIYKDGARDEQAEKFIAEKFTDIFIGTREDITNETAENFTFSYTTSQGYFELTLPKNSAHIMDAESTVENISAEIHVLLTQEFGAQNFTVQAFEGHKKGAIYNS